MASRELEAIIRQATRLSPDEQLDLIAYLAQKAREGYRASSMQPASGESRRLPEDELSAAEMRLLRYIGAASLGYPTGSDNEGIDNDLAGEYRAIREDPD